MIKDYQHAIKLLNSLQSNAAQIRERLHHPSLNILNMKGFMQRLSMTEIVSFGSDKILPVIHVTGTKGKGSIAAFCESVLREHGLSTGLYTSPHLRSVCERMKLNGKSISEEAFAHHFFHIWSLLKNNPSVNHESCSSYFMYSQCIAGMKEMPSYFEFLTLMGFYLFDYHRVDIAIMEVGIGGLYDATNVIENPLATVITPIGYDHMEKLGQTLEEIATNKAGIMKPGCPVFIASNQEPSVFALLKKHAQSLTAPYFVAKSIREYGIDDTSFPLGLKGKHQFENASLALSICEYILPQLKGGRVGLNETSLLHGLKNVSWPGRTQRIDWGSHLSFYFDGAHTVESMSVCVDWFKDETSTNTSNVKRALVFYCSPDRDPIKLLTPLAMFHKYKSFFKLYFPRNEIQPNASDNFTDHQIACKNSWEMVLGDEAEKGEIILSNNIGAIQQDLELLAAKDHYHVLVTGSLHLIGSFFNLLDISIK